MFKGHCNVQSWIDITKHAMVFERKLGIQAILYIMMNV